MRTVLRRPEPNTIAAAGARGGSGRRNDDGATLVTIVLFPLFCICVFGMAQAIQWRHERQVAVAAAQETASAIVLYQSDPSAAEQNGRAMLAAAGLRSVTLTVTGGGTTTVRVTVHATAPGILIGTKATVDVSATSTTETWKK
jgi:Flp pilus assembly protein TadG